MTITSNIYKKINQLPNGKTFGYADLHIAKNDYSAAAKALSRLVEKNFIKKISKGIFYKPEQTSFGELMPDYQELLRPYLFKNGKRIAYETGTSLYNRLGLTSQIPFRIKIASIHKRINIDGKILKTQAVKSYTKVTNSNYQILGLLDAFKDIKHIPDCSITQGIHRLSAIINELTHQQQKDLIKYALLYPPRVRALLGAILENENKEVTLLIKLKESLNPLTTIQLGVSKTELPTKNNWYIK